LGTVTFDQRQTPADFVENRVAWQDPGNVQLIGDTLVVQLTDEAGPPGSFVVADAVRMERVGGAPVEPEIEVTVDGVAVPDGTGSVSFGSTKINKPKTKTITVRHVGLLDLSLGTITMPFGFSLLADVGTTVLAPGQTTSFIVQLDANFGRTYTEVVSFDTNDSDENPIDFGVSGTVTQSSNCSNCHSAAN
jgi:hypothetical protein